MKTIYIGDHIRQRRKDLKLSQSQVCSGICDPVTLSRIEGGKQMPSYKHIIAILQRLGMPDACYYALESNNELQIELLKKEIIACNSSNCLNEGYDKLDLLEQLTDDSDCLTLQFLLRSKCMLDFTSGKINLKEQREILIHAIRLTIPSFDIDSIDSYLYTHDEIKLIVSIANNYSDSGEHEIAIDIFYQLLKYINKHYSEVITSGGMLPFVLYGYARALDLYGNFKEGSLRAMEGINACVSNGHYQFLYACLAIYAQCCYHLNDKAASAKAYRQAYVLCELTGTTQALDVIKKEASCYLGLDLELEFSYRISNHV